MLETKRDALTVVGDDGRELGIFRLEDAGELL